MVRKPQTWAYRVTLHFPTSKIKEIYLCILFDMSQGDANSSEHPFIGTEWLWVPQTLQAGFHHPPADVI